MRRAWFAVLLAGSVPVAAASQADRAANSTAPVAVPAAEMAAGLPGAELLAKQSACIACHDAEGNAAERLAFTAAPDLTEIAAHRAPGWIAQYLTAEDSPHPQVLAGNEGQRMREAQALATFLTGGLEPQWEGVAVGPAAIAEGERLFQDLGCYACHTDGFAGRDLAAGWSVAGLADALANPAGHPVLTGRMPDMQLDEGEAMALSAWLLREQQAHTKAVEVAGFKYAYYEEETFNASGVDWASLTPRSTGTTETVTHQLGDRKQYYGLVLEATLQVPQAGEYRFWTTSDDGSELFLNGERLVDNLGTHPMQRRESAPMQLEAGPHDLRITFFEQSGGEGLLAGWSGPGFEAREFASSDVRYISSVPMPLERAFPTANDAVREAGRALYDQRKCASCHDAGAGVPDSAPTLAELRAESAGCLSSDPAAPAIDYGFDADQRELLVNLLRNRSGLAQPRDAHSEIFVQMNQHQCTACHARDGVGAPSDAVLASFVGADDLGDEGRVPPTLHDVGAKLTEGALGHSIAHGLEYRPSVKARMPAFRDVDQQLSWSLTELLKEVDSVDAPREAPSFEAEDAKLGHRLSGTQGGLACIACHGAGGHPSVGVQGPSLSAMAERLEYDWYARWMENPPAMRPGTRMLNVFGSGQSPITDVHGGDAAAQIDSIWQYLSLGESMPLPAGLVADRSSYELTPIERPVYFGTFYRDASARVMAVGFPERVSAAFDMHHGRLVEVWRGDFMNAKGTWDGRAGQLEGAGGTDVLAMPAGPAVAVGASAEEWPAAEKDRVDILGHDRDALGHPTFRYRLVPEGIEVAESLTPQLAAGGATLTRTFVLRAPRPVPRTQIRVHDGSDVRLIPVTWTTGSDGAAEFVVEVPIQW